jgi:hypothetical protein
MKDRVDKSMGIVTLIPETLVKIKPTEFFRLGKESLFFPSGMSLSVCMTTSQRSTDAQIKDVLREGLPHLADPVSLQDQRFDQQTQGIGIQSE